MTGQTVYIIELEYFDENRCEEFAPKKTFIVGTADIALSFYHDICRKQDWWEAFDCPTGIYMRKQTVCYPSQIEKARYYEEDSGFLVMDLGIDSYLKE